VVGVAAATTLVARWYGGTDLNLEESPVREPGPGEVLVRMLASGVCGTDVHALDGEFNLWPTPLVLGHEGVGIVEETAVEGLEPGRLVAIAPSTSCGSCFHCREGEELLCRARTVIAGSFAEWSTPPGGAVYPVPDGVGWRKAVLTEPLSCALHAAALAGIRPGHRVAIVGGGTMGILAMLVATASGADTIVSEPSAERREIALALGAGEVVDPADLVDAAAELTDGVGVDAAIEAVGAAVTAAQAIELPRRGGTIVLMGVAPRAAEVSIRPYDLYERELTIRGSFIRRYEFQQALRLLGRLPVERLVTDVFALSQLHAALDHVAARRGLKTVVAPDPEALP
jgi:2-desacetyl-2-hydroxyethyl bacteriochlorophyllide A dehydrogenase